jgi:hypothetical protein
MSRATANGMTRSNGTLNTVKMAVAFAAPQKMSRVVESDSKSLA